jgi:hypothetical protein
MADVNFLRCYTNAYVQCGIEGRDNFNLFNRSFNTTVLVGLLPDFGSSGLQFQFMDNEPGSGNENDTFHIGGVIMKVSCARWDCRRVTSERNGHQGIYVYLVAKFDDGDGVEDENFILVLKFTGHERYRSIKSALHRVFGDEICGFSHDEIGHNQDEQDSGENA